MGSSSETQREILFSKPIGVGDPYNHNRPSLSSREPTFDQSGNFYSTNRKTFTRPKRFRSCSIITRFHEQDICWWQGEGMGMGGGSRGQHDSNKHSFSQDSSLPRSEENISSIAQTEDKYSSSASRCFNRVSAFLQGLNSWV